MARKFVTSEEAEALKHQVLKAIGLPFDTHIDLVPSALNDLVNCRVETSSFTVREGLTERFHGHSVGDSVYFCVPKPKARKH